MNRTSLAYWIPTGLFCAVLTFSGLAHLFRADMMVEGVTGLGYPIYLLTILGTAKLLGVAALLAPAKPLLKEWAYAGFTFNLLGASASHAFAGDPVAEVLPPLALLALAAASYHFRPAPRRLAATRNASA